MIVYKQNVGYHFTFYYSSGSNKAAEKNLFEGVVAEITKEALPVSSENKIKRIKETRKKGMVFVGNNKLTMVQNVNMPGFRLGK